MQKQIVFFQFVHQSHDQTIDIVKYMGKFTFQNCEWITTSVNKIRVKELHQVVEMAFKQMSVMSSKDANVKMFREWNDNVHRALEPILSD